MENGVTNRQLVFILYLLSGTITLAALPKQMAVDAGTGGWVPVLLGAVIFALMALVFAGLNKMYRGRVMLDYSRDLVGKYGAVVIAVVYILFFLVYSVFLCSTFAGILAADFLPNTPVWADLLISMPLLGYMAYKGVTNLGRISEIFGILLLVVGVLLRIAMLFQGRANYALPLYVPADTLEYVSAVRDGMMCFIGITVLSIIPFTQRNKKVSGVSFFAVLGLGMYLALSVEGSIMMLGRHAVLHYDDAFVEAIRLIQIPEVQFIQRVDVSYLTVTFFGVFTCMAFVIMAIVEFVCRLVPRWKRLWVVVASCSLVFGLTLLSNGTKDFDKANAAVLKYASLVTVFFLPLLLWVIAKVKNRGKKTG